ncbi:Estradiol 17-beta-dehydrogenase 2 [Holothuria leucospilota]|uniref:Estradiol 17-beta-dehydrogenase 2 n=1 Tax=Holothuria leucospilota TaxID=206669 RepID=A0A9Q0YQF8_HOLLE|nr:Estradiol 17-beta-dehydrogenase 2 [Holothuria leucospilota]
MSLKLILYSAITIFFNGAVLRRYLKDELLLAGPYTLLVILPTITQPVCQLIFGGFCGITLFAIASYQIYKRLPQQFVNYDDKVVFISGCDSGFGHETAKRLDAKGVHVIAGCLLKGESGEQDLVKSCSDRLVTIQLDVTKEDSVQNAVKEVKEKLQGRDLWALVNNAGILYIAEAEIMSLKYVRSMMDVNFMGAVRLTKAFLPMLRQSEGRVVSLCSIGTLLAKENVNNKLEAVYQEMEPSLKEDYGPRYKDEWFRIFTAGYEASQDLSPVINTIEHALFAKSPLTMYNPELSGEVFRWINICLPVSFTKHLLGALVMSGNFISKDFQKVTEKDQNADEVKRGDAGNNKHTDQSGEGDSEE